MKETSLPRPRMMAIDRRQMVLRTIDVEALIDEDHSARSIWDLVGRLDLSLYHAAIASVEGSAGREHTDPHLLICLWLYAYSRGISSAREIARRCEYEPAFQWLCGLDPVSHRTLSGFRSDHKAALDDLFVQVVGLLSAEGLVALERVTLDGTKIRASAGGNTFRRREKIEAHLEMAREQVRILDEQAKEEEKVTARVVAARRRAARQRRSGLEAALREVERLQSERKSERAAYVARASTTDPESHIMRNGDGGTVPSYNVQLVTDTEHGLIVNVEATTDAIDYRQLERALDRCLLTIGAQPSQILADGDYTNHTSVRAAARHGVNFYGSWQESWRPGDHDAMGRSSEFQASAFPYDAASDCYRCPAGETMTLHAMMNRENGVRARVYRAPKKACRECVHRSDCAPPNARVQWVRAITRNEEPAETIAFKAKMRTEEAQRIYRRRSQIAEFPHAWIKERCGLRQFRCRGRTKATMEATWACLSYNLTRWFSIRRRRNLTAVAATA